MEVKNVSYKQKLVPDPYKVPVFPGILVAALTNVCTHRCNHCQYQSYIKKRNYEKKHMEGIVFNRIVDQMKEYNNVALRLCAWGEPLLHPDIVEFIKYAAQNRVRTILLSNGYPLNKELAYKILDAGLDFVEISIDAARIETYRKVRKCPDENAFYKVCKNLEEMVKIRNQYNFPTKIVTSYVTWPDEESQNEFLLFNSMWKTVVDNVVKRRLHSFMGAVDSKLVKVPDDRLPCYGLWARGIVNPWGKIIICYNQWEKDKWSVGDLNDDSTTIAGVWKGEVLSSMRKNQVQGFFEGPCEKCVDYNPFAWDHPFEEVISKIDNRLN